MRAVITLLVLSMCGAQTRGTQTELHSEKSQSTGPATAAAVPDGQDGIYAELKELRDMVVKQRVILKCTQDQLKKMEAENAAVEKRLVASETKVVALERVTAVQQTELTAMKTEMMNMKMENADFQERLLTSETKVVALEGVNDAQDARLTACETMVEDIKTDSAAQDSKLTELQSTLAATETDVQNLENIMENSKVAFSAGLTNSGHIQAGNTHLNLVFSGIITNVGGGYSSLTGVFTAPVKGVYYFRFNVMDINRTGSVSIETLKNGKRVMFNSEFDDNGVRIRGSNGLTLQLEVGDTVNLALYQGHRLWDDGGSYFNNFSGFLLFTL